MQKFEEYNVCVKIYGDTLSAFSGDELSKKAASALGELTKVVLDIDPDRTCKFLSWFCLDFNHSNQPENDMYSLSTIKNRIDAHTSETERVRVFITIVMTLKRPKLFDAMQSGRQGYRNWLLEAFSKQVRLTWGSSSSDRIRSLADCTKFWLSGDVDRVYRNDSNGNLQLLGSDLQEPEEAFTDSFLAIGPDAKRENK
jgi:hypothetical protein